MENLVQLWHSTGIYHLQWGQAVMIAVCLLLLWLAIRKGFEPLLLVPIGFGGILANIPLAGLAESALGHALYYGDAALVAQVKTLLGVAADTTVTQVKDAFYAAPPDLHAQVDFLVRQHGHSDGILYLIYSVGLMTGLFRC